MSLKIGHKLKQKEIKSTIKNVENTSNDLVKKVLAEETTFTRECKRLMHCNKEEFYQKRDGLIDALSEYTFIGSISEDKKRLIDYKLFHEELKEIGKKKTLHSIGIYGGLAGMIGLFTLAGLSIDTSVALYFASAFGGVGSGAIGLGSSLTKPNIKLGELPNHHVALKSYSEIIKKSKDADDFTADISLLKRMYAPIWKK